MEDLYGPTALKAHQKFFPDTGIGAWMALPRYWRRRTLFPVVSLGAQPWFASLCQVTKTCKLTVSVLGTSSDNPESIDSVLETGMGGGKSQKIRGGGENFEYPGAPENSNPFLQRFYRKSSILG